MKWGALFGLECSRQLRPDVSRGERRLERQRCLTDQAEVGDYGAAPLARGKMRLDHDARTLVERPVDVVTERDLVVLTAHCPIPLNITRSFMRALCTCDFEVPSDTPRSFATSLCSNPS